MGDEKGAVEEVDKHVKELGKDEPEEKAGPLLDHGEEDRRKSKTRGERTCDACGKKFSYLKRLVAHIEKDASCKDHYKMNKIELPIAKERGTTKKERKDFVTKTSQNIETLIETARNRPLWRRQDRDA